MTNVLIHMDNKIRITIGVLVLLGAVIIAVLFLTVLDTEKQGDQGIINQEVRADDPVDIVMDFYDPWLVAMKSTSTDPYTSGFVTEKILSNGLRSKLTNSEGHGATEIDPVLCQTTTPEQVTGRMVSQQEDEVRVLVMAKEKELTGQSVFMLKRHNDGWYIDDILCSPGEFAPEREFSFEREGHLLKSVPPPLDPNLWHIIFEENNELGHFAPLLFDEGSICRSIDGKEAVCNHDQLTEGIKVHISGQMLESGVEVKRLEFFE